MTDTLFGDCMKIKDCTQEFFKELAVEICPDSHLLSPKNIDYRCLDIAIARFLDSGQKDDAFDVFFCFSEIFKLFGRGYDSVKTLLDLLADHEIYTGSLLQKHRDHYSHSVYVFSIGLALFQKNENIREQFIFAYNEGERSLENFLYRWGTASLFHDIGYPFEIAAKSIVEYSNRLFGSNPQHVPTSSIDTEKLIKFNKEEEKWLETLYSDEEKNYQNVHELLIPTIKKMTNESRENIEAQLTLLSNSSKSYDHGYNSAILLVKSLVKSKNCNKIDLEIILEAAVAALMHCGFYKFGLGESKIISIKDNVIAFLLMLCDDLQIFDRQGYGRDTVGEPLSRDCFIDISEDKKQITFAYAFPDNAIEYIAPNNSTPNNDYIKDEMKELRDKLNKHYDLDSIGGLTVVAEINNIRAKGTHNSVSYFKNIFDIAVKIHSNYLDAKFYNAIEEKWDDLSLELKMSNILQAKSYADKLDLINCFYFDKELMLEPVEKLTSIETDKLARYEHERWRKEKQDMGWSCADYSTFHDNKKQSAQAERKNNCLVEYDMLSNNDREKDLKSVKNIIPNLKSINFFIYRTSEQRNIKKEERIGIVNFDNNCSDELFNQTITRIKNRLNENAENQFICGFSDFDLKIAEKVLDLEMKVKIVISRMSNLPHSEILDRLETKDGVCVIKLPISNDSPEYTVMKYIATNSDTIMAIGELPPSICANPLISVLIMAKEYGQNIEYVAQNNSQ